MDLELPPKSSVYADSAYTDYSIKSLSLIFIRACPDVGQEQALMKIRDALDDCDGINLDPVRKKNSLRYDEPSIHLYKKLARKLIETVFSQIVSWFGKVDTCSYIKGFLTQS